MNLLNYILLPKEKSATEVAHVKKINKVALMVAYLHVPFFVLVAYLCNTGVREALFFSALLLAGPTIAYKTVDNPRTLSLVFGFTSMCLGALLVHLGQSSVQIEMHFHFFVFLALLSVYGNPLTVLVAAVTVALHHLVFFFFLPQSVFNYDAAVWVVGIHALFVVLESIASCFIARNFFDNVIGLEKIVNARTEQLDKRNDEMRLILDNASQGFLTANVDGSLEEERSEVVSKWFGKENPGEKIWDLVSKSDQQAGTMLQVGFDGIIEDFMPLEITLDQLPKRVKLTESTIGCEYRPIFNGDKVEKVLFVTTDISSELEREKYEREQREIVQVFEHMTKDRSGFIEYLDEASQIVDFVTRRDKQGNMEEIKRAIHTLKGISGVFGVNTIFDLCHDVETRIEEEKEFLNQDRKLLHDSWKEARDKFDRLVGDKRKTLDIAEDDIATLIDLLRTGTDPKKAINVVNSWRFEPTEKRLQRIADQARGIAERLRKGNFSIDIDHQKLRLSQAAWSNFWSSFIHVVRNAVDHGLLESTDGQPRKNSLALRTYTDDLNLVIEIEDNGRGIDWKTVEERAQKKGIPHGNHEQLVDALFHDGLSTKEEATAYSGRGVGLGAVKDACQKLGGHIEVESELDKGTKFRFVFPVGAANYESQFSKAA